MFCTNCGNQFEGKFCPSCGTPAGNAASPANTQAAPAVQSNQNSVLEEKTLWEGSPSGIKGKAKSAGKVNDVKYKITNQRIIIESGLVTKRCEEIELSTISDYHVKQSLAEKLQHIGDILIIASDITSPIAILEDVENPQEVKETIRSAVMSYKRSMNVTQIQGV